MTAPSTPAPQVLGRTIDTQTRCVHYGGPTDIIALKFKCCGDFYPCYECHEETAAHPVERWIGADTSEPAILCGACSGLLTIAEYLLADRCPACDSEFNPGCKLHRDLYFDLPARPENDAATLASTEDGTAPRSTTPEREQP